MEDNDSKKKKPVEKPVNKPIVKESEWELDNIVRKRESFLKIIK